MVIIKNKAIQNIPVFEVYKDENKNKVLPLIVFYHGWESRKERVLEYGYTLAKKGFRVVLPEALNHGERQVDKSGEQDSLDFWKVVVQNVKEFPLLAKYYIEKNLVLDGKISVAGLSMGGITVSAMLTQYDWIHSAVILMGSPAPIEFSKWLLKNYTIDGTALYDTLDKKEVEAKLAKLHPISLALHPEKLANRPVYFWHGTDDPIVPIHLTKHFIEKIKDEPYSERLEYEYSKGIDHVVPREIVIRATEFLSKVNV